MKEPKPTIPKGAPEGTVWFGGPIEWFVIRLNITSDSLVPEEVTRLLKTKPDEAFEKGKPILREDGTVARVPRFGAWKIKLRREQTDEWNCCEAIMEVLQRLPSDIAIWTKLAKRYKICLTVALSMESTNKGLKLSTEVMKYLGDRHITADFDIYYAP